MIILEGFILDDDYLRAISNKSFLSSEVHFVVWIATTCLASPPVDWQGQDTFIQSEGLADDLWGVLTIRTVFIEKRVQT